jgi:hypothetical protein
MTVEEYTLGTLQSRSRDSKSMRKTITTKGRNVAYCSSGIIIRHNYTQQWVTFVMICKLILCFQTYLNRLKKQSNE